MSAMPNTILLCLSFFFRENFVQVDVFFKEMVYEKISVQKAFEFLSLLGEIGGFLGLLLGASVMTICEIIDFLLLTTYKAVSKKTNNNASTRDTGVTQVRVQWNNVHV